MTATIRCGRSLCLQSSRLLVVEGKHTTTNNRNPAMMGKRWLSSSSNKPTNSGGNGGGSSDVLWHAATLGAVGLSFFGVRWGIQNLGGQMDSQDDDMNYEEGKLTVFCFPKPSHRTGEEMRVSF